MSKNKKIIWDFNYPRPLEQHTLAKHEILRAYLVRYVQTLISTPFQEELKLTLIDGFSGGGIYQHSVTKEIVYGSPLIMLEAIEEAKYLINQNRRKLIRLKIDYFFIDNDKKACNCLEQTLNLKNYAHLINNSIFIHNSSFENESDKIISFIQQKSRAKRAIFLLDQYGYKEVPTPLIKKILNSSPNSEIILNFNVDSLLTYVSDKGDLAQKLLNGIGIPDALKGRTVEDIKSSERDWRLYIQSCLYKELVQNCGARYYTSFFIRSSGGHGDYWLLHLSQHPKARDVMTEIHWKNNNYFIHYGGSGLDMFMNGHIPELDNNYTGQFEWNDFCFNTFAREKSKNSLINDIRYLVEKNSNGIKFCVLFSNTCNHSPASAEIYKEAIAELIRYKDIEVFGEQGEKRQSASSIKDNDVLKLKQCSIFTY